MSSKNNSRRPLPEIPTPIHPQNPYTMAALQNSLIKSNFDPIAERIINTMCWKDEEKIVEVGCGSGKLIRDYWLPLISKKSKFPMITGLDESQEMVEYAKSQVKPNQNVRYISFVDIPPQVSHNTISEGSMDKIISCFVLSYYEKDRLKSCLDDWYQVLNNEGQLAIVLAFSGSSTEVSEPRIFSPLQLFSMRQWSTPDSCSFKTVKTYGISPWARIYPSNEKEAFELLQQLLVDAKFNIFDVFSTDFGSKFKNLDELFEFIQISDSKNALIPNQTLEDELNFDKLCLKQECKSCRGQDPLTPFEIRWKFVAILAQKQRTISTALNEPVYQTPYIMAALQNVELKFHFDDLVQLITNNLYWSHGETILEHGCGSGKLIHDYWLPIAVAKSSTIIGMDISHVMLDYAREILFPRPAFSNIRFVSSLHGIQENSIDKIISSFVLSYRSETSFQPLFESWHKKLKPNGQLAIILAFSMGGILASRLQTFSMHKWSNFQGTHNEKYQIAEWARMFPDSDALEASLRRFLIRAKFNKIRVFNIPMRRTFRNILELEEFLQISDSSNSQIPGPLKAELAIEKQFLHNHLVVRLAQHPAHEPITVCWNFMTVLAENGTTGLPATWADA